VGDAVFIPAGTVHSLGDNVAVFEIQQNRDTTFRLYDWNHVDSNTSKPRALQIDQALACVDVTSTGAGLIQPLPETAPWRKQEMLFDYEFFRLIRFCGSVSFEVGERGMPVSWYVSMAPDRSVMTTKSNSFAEAKYGSCLQVSGHSSFNRPHRDPAGSVNTCASAYPCRNDVVMKHLIVFDLNGTLVPSKSAIDTSKAALLHTS
jgi:hypothetical protein